MESFSDEQMAIIIADREARAAYALDKSVPIEVLDPRNDCWPPVLFTGPLCLRRFYRLAQQRRNPEPPQPEPHYRPYTDEELAWLVGETVRTKKNGSSYVVIGRPTYNGYGAVEVNGRLCDAKELFEECELRTRHPNRTCSYEPCGVLVEGKG